MKWMQKTIEVRAAISMPMSDKPWTAGHNLTGVPLVNRNIYLIDTMYQVYVNECETEGVLTEEMKERPDLFCDYTQCISRYPKQRRHHCGAHQHNGDYSYEGQRALTFRD